jgi:hypothetical protein
MLTLIAMVALGTSFWVDGEDDELDGVMDSHGRVDREVWLRSLADTFKRSLHPAWHFLPRLSSDWTSPSWSVQRAWILQMLKRASDAASAAAVSSGVEGIEVGIAQTQDLHRLRPLAEVLADLQRYVLAGATRQQWEELQGQLESYYEEWPFPAENDQRTEEAFEHQKEILVGSAAAVCDIALGTQRDAFSYSIYWARNQPEMLEVLAEDLDRLLMHQATQTPEGLYWLSVNARYLPHIVKGLAPWQRVVLDEAEDTGQPMAPARFEQFQKRAARPPEPVSFRQNPARKRPDVALSVPQDPRDPELIQWERNASPEAQALLQELLAAPDLGAFREIQNRIPGPVMPELFRNFPYSKQRLDTKRRELRELRRRSR